MTAPLLVMISVNSTMYRLLVFVFPQYLIGIDPSSYALDASRAAATGDLSSIELYFYDTAAGFLSYVITVNHTTGVSIHQSFFFFSILTGVGYPLFSYLILRNSVVSTKIQLLAALVTSVASYSIMFSFWPIAQTQTAVILLLFIYCVVPLAQFGDVRFKTLLVILSLSIVLTHKLSPLALVIFLFTLFSLVALSRGDILSSSPNTGWILFRSFQDNSIIVLSMITVLFTAVLWIFFTGFISNVVDRMLVAFFISEPAEEPFHATVATRPLSRSWHLLLYRANTIVLILLGGISWIYILITRQWRSDFLFALILAAGASTGIFVVFSVISDEAILISRGIFLYEAFAILCVLCAVFLFSKRHSVNPVFPIVLLLLGSQIGVGIIVPDPSYGPRYYLTDQEINGKEFNAQYNSQETYTDFFYSTQRTNFDPDDDHVVYRDIGYDLLNDNVHAPDRDRVILREGVEIFGTAKHADWRIDWDQVNGVEMRYNRTYTNGGVSIYQSG